MKRSKNRKMVLSLEHSSNCNMASADQFIKDKPCPECQIRYCQRKSPRCKACWMRKLNSNRRSHKETHPHLYPRGRKSAIRARDIKEFPCPTCEIGKMKTGAYTCIACSNKFRSQRMKIEAAERRLADRIALQKLRKRYEEEQRKFEAQ